MEKDEIEITEEVEKAGAAVIAKYADVFNGRSIAAEMFEAMITVCSAA